MKFMEVLPQIVKLLRDEYGGNLINVSTVERISKNRLRVVYVVRAKIGKTEEIIVELSRDILVEQKDNDILLIPLWNIQIKKADLRGDTRIVNVDQCGGIRVVKL